MVPTILFDQPAEDMVLRLVGTTFTDPGPSGSVRSPFSARRIISRIELDCPGQRTADGGWQTGRASPITLIVRFVPLPVVGWLQRGEREPTGAFKVRVARRRSNGALANRASHIPGEWSSKLRPLEVGVARRAIRNS